MITFDMAAYLLSFFFFFFFFFFFYFNLQHYNFEKQTNKQGKTTKKTTTKNWSFIKNQQILPHAKFKEPFLNLLHLL